MDTLSVVQGDTHPLLLLLSDLKSSLINFQNEAYTSAVKLQHHSLSTTRALERTHALEHENSVLNDELHILRSNPHPFSSNESGVTARESINQLTLSLRTLNEKLTDTEAILARRTAELTHTLGELQRSRSATDAAHELSARIRGREEAVKSRERELELKVRMAEERAKMSERAVEEYANLVRTLEGRTSRAGNVQRNGNAVHSTSDEDTQDLLQESTRERENLQIQLSSAQHDMALLTSEHTALSKSTETTLAELADLRMKLQLLERDDTTATKMVSRYMKFSQTQINQLQNSLSTLSTRHTSTLSSLTAQIQSLTQTLTLAQSHNAQLLSALDNLGNEVMKEGYGRRREVRLRIKLVGREERVLEGLRRWLRRAEEECGKVRESGGTGDHGGEGSVLAEMIQNAKILIDDLDSPLLLPTPQRSQDVHPPPVSGSLARLITIQSTIDDLVEDAQREQAKRIALEKLVVRQEIEGATLDILVDREEDELRFQQENEVEEKVDFSNLSIEPPKDEDQTVRIPSSPIPNLESPLDRVEDATSSPVLLSANHGTTLPESEPDNVDNVFSTSLPVSTPVSTPQPQPATPTIKITPPLPLNEPTPQSFDFSEYVSEKEEAKPENDYNGMALEKGDDGNQIVGGVCDSVQGTEGGVVGELSNADSSVLRTDTLEAQETLPGDAPEETTAPKSAEETGPDNSRAVSAEEDKEKENVNIQPSYFDAASSTEPTTPVHPQPRPPPQVPALSLSHPSSPSFPPTQSPSRLPKLTPPAPHPLLGDLSKARNRYDHIQRAFHACHIAIEGLKASLPLTTTNPDSSPTLHAHPSNDSGGSLSSSSTVIPNDVLKAIVQRLDDYTEDARVELEIRISDEEVMGRGYEALLMLPGALSSVVSPLSSSTLGRETNDDTATDAGSLVDVEAQIRTFINGTDSTISRATKSFERKLEDIEHDVVVVKQVLHDPHSLFQSSLPTMTAIESSSPILGDSSASTGWTSWIRTPISRPSTPTLAPAPAPTFGNIMTSRNTRPSSVLRRTVSTFGLSSDSMPSPSGSGTDLVQSLGLKVPMPDFTFTLTSALSGSPGGGGGEDDENYESPSGTGMSFGGLGFGHTFGTPRSRTISTSMYMLGMGMGSPGVGARMANKRSPGASPLQRRVVSATAPPQTSVGRGIGDSGRVLGSSVSPSSRQTAEDEDVD